MISKKWISLVTMTVIWLNLGHQLAQIQVHINDTYYSVIKQLFTAEEVLQSCKLRIQGIDRTSAKITHNQDIPQNVSEAEVILTDVQAGTKGDVCLDKCQPSEGPPTDCEHFHLSALPVRCFVDKDDLVLEFDRPYSYVNHYEVRVVGEDGVEVNTTQVSDMTYSIKFSLPLDHNYLFYVFTRISHEISGYDARVGPITCNSGGSSSLGITNKPNSTSSTDLVFWTVKAFIVYNVIAIIVLPVLAVIVIRLCKIHINRRNVDDNHQDFELGLIQQPLPTGTSQTRLLGNYDDEGHVY